MQDVFALEPKTTIPQDESYIISYPYLVGYFSAKSSFSATDLVAGAHMAYGWMPTILDLYPKKSRISFDGGAELLTKAKQTGTLDDAELQSLAWLVNNSLVGASKLLHFVSPGTFAIWDSRVYSFLHEDRPYNTRVNNVLTYRAYLRILAVLRQDSRFPAFHVSINQKVGYEVSALRALELVMFNNSFKTKLLGGAAELGP